MPKTVREVVKILKKNGFYKVDQNGSHMKFFNSQTKRTTIVPNHKGDIPIGTENNIWKQAGLKQPLPSHRHIANLIIEGEDYYDQ